MWLYRLVIPKLPEAVVDLKKSKDSQLVSSMDDSVVCGRFVTLLEEQYELNKRDVLGK